jgi:hypothetical protein
MRLFVERDDAARIAQQLDAFFGQPHLMRRPLEQRFSQQLLQPPDLLADGRLRQRDAIGGAGETAGLANRDKADQQLRAEHRIACHFLAVSTIADSYLPAIIYGNAGLGSVQAGSGRPPVDRKPENADQTRGRSHDFECDIRVAAGDIVGQAPQRLRHIGDERTHLGAVFVPEAGKQAEERIGKVQQRRGRLRRGECRMRYLRHGLAFTG